MLHTPLIIPGRPPKIEVIKPIINAAYKPTNGSTPATNAKATASGTNANATVIPLKISFLAFLVRFLIKLVMMVSFGSGKNTDKS